MNSSAAKVKAFPHYGQPPAKAERARTAPARTAEVRKQRDFNALSVIVSMLSAVLFSVASLVSAVIAVALLIFIVPWLLLAPVIVVSLLVSLAGLVFSGLGLI
jgi:hypothetical protein